MCGLSAASSEALTGVILLSLHPVDVLLTYVLAAMVDKQLCLFVFLASHTINIKVAFYQEPGSGEVLHLQC